MAYTSYDINKFAPFWQQLAKQAPEYNSAQKVISLLQTAGFEAYLVGGAVRDILLNELPKDFDVVTNAKPQQILAIKSLERAEYKDTAQAYGVTRVHLHGKVLEVATFRKDIGAHRGRKQTEVAFATLAEDIARRDFTINALAFNPINHELLDEIGSLNDLSAKIIRFIGKPEERIQEDPLRILRAIRFRNALGFEYEPQTYQAIKASVAKGSIETIAVDRLRQELTRILQHKSRQQAVIDLADFGILKLILPEVTAGKKVRQPHKYHAEGSVWNHQLLTLAALPENPSRRLVWAALLHDIGKAKSQAGVGEGRTFHNHYRVGAELARSILKRLYFSNKDSADIYWMIYHHMNIDELPKMRRSKQHQMLSHPAFADLLELHRADATASWHGNKHGEEPVFTAIEKLWQDYRQTPHEKRRPSLKVDLGIDGRWLIDNLGVPPGQTLGYVLSELQDWYHDTGITDIDAYKQKVYELLKQKQS